MFGHGPNDKNQAMNFSRDPTWWPIFGGKTPPPKSHGKSSNKIGRYGEKLPGFSRYKLDNYPPNLLAGTARVDPTTTSDRSRNLAGWMTDFLVFFLQPKWDLQKQGRRSTGMMVSKSNSPKMMGEFKWTIEFLLPTWLLQGGWPFFNGCLNMIAA